MKVNITKTQKVRVDGNNVYDGGYWLSSLGGR